MDAVAIVVDDRRYMSRKFVFCTVAWVVGTIGWGLGFFLNAIVMTTEQWILFTQWIVGLYLTGNVGDTFATALASVFIKK